MSAFYKRLISQKIARGIFGGNKTSECAQIQLEKRLRKLLRVPPVRKDLSGSPHLVAELPSLTKCLNGNPLNLDQVQIEGGVEVQVTSDALNFRAEPAQFIQRVLDDIRSNGSDYGYVDQKEEENESVFVEFSSPNIAKPFHVGHMRSTIIGNVIANLYEAAGHDVKRINFLGDWGTQFGLLSLGMTRYVDIEQLKVDPLLELFNVYVRINKDIKSECGKASETTSPTYQEGMELFAKLENGDESMKAIWNMVKQVSDLSLNQMYQRLGVNFTHTMPESDYQDKTQQVLQHLSEAGLLQYDADGVGYVQMDNEDSIGRASVVKSDGSSLYLTRDIASALDRQEKFPTSRAHYVPIRSSLIMVRYSHNPPGLKGHCMMEKCTVESGQRGHFIKLVNILNQLGVPWASRSVNDIHIRFGRVKGMSTRQGNVVFLRDILDEAKARVLYSMAARSTTRVTDDAEAVADILGVTAIALQSKNAGAAVAENHEMRVRQPKQPKPAPLSNAEKCRRYKENLKKDPVAYEAFKEKRREEESRRRACLTVEQKEERKGKNRIRQQKYRANKAKGYGKKQLSKPTTPQRTPSKCFQLQLTPTVKTREQRQKEVDKRERNRLSQQKRRSNMSAQKKRREREKRVEYYNRTKKAPASPSSTKPTGVIRLKSLLNGVVKAVKRSRTKLSLFKLNFAKKLLARERPNDKFESLYRRPIRTSSSVEQCYINSSIDYPGQKSGSTPSKVLTKTLIDLYKEYKKSYPQHKVSLTTFKRLRPRNVCLASNRKFVQCLCERCTNVMLLMDVVNQFLRPKSDRGLLNERVTNVDELLNKTLCENVRRNCWERECDSCGVSALLCSFRLAVGERLEVIKEMKRWGKNDNGRKDLLVSQCSVGTILGQLEEDLTSLAKHLKVAHWQRHQYQSLAKVLPPRHAICTVDFAENYLCRYQYEVQSAHWSYHQVSIHPCVFFYSCLDCSKLVTEYLVFLSDDLKHDSYFTRSVLDKCIEHMKQKGVVSLHIFSDGCGAQYKSKSTFMDLSELQIQHKTMTLTRYFFGSNHGKSLCDSCGGVVKNCATRAVASGEFLIQNAKQMFDFCQEKLLIQFDDCLHIQSKRSFFLLDRNDIVRPSDVPVLRPVPGTRQIHCLKPSRTQSGVLSVSSLSCTCVSCLIGEDEPCPNQDFTDGWRTVSVKSVASESRVQTKNKKDNGIVTEAQTVEPAFNEAFVVDSGLHENLFNEVSPESEQCIQISDSALASGSSCSRSSFFLELQRRLTSCVSFAMLASVAFESLSEVASFPMPPFVHRTVLQLGIVDSIALGFRPAGLEHLFPVLTESDGNCVPRTLSMLCFGDEDHHVELRCRIAIELACNQFDYLCLDKKELMLLGQLSDYACSDIPKTFRNETLSICKNGIFMGLWQLMAAANVVGAPVLSVYPEQGPAIYIKTMNRKIMPRASEIRTSDPLILMWSSTRRSEEMPEDYWVANHVVPLVPISEPTEVVLE